MNKNNPTLKDTFGTAYQNYRKGDLKTAETLCYKILSIDPNFIQSKTLLANISAKNRDFIKTKKLLNEALDMDPNNVSDLNKLGTACTELGDVPTANTVFVSPPTGWVTNGDDNCPDDNNADQWNYDGDAACD